MLKVPAISLHVHACLPNTVHMLANTLTDAVQLSQHSQSASAEQSQNPIAILSCLPHVMLRRCVSMQL